MNEASRFSNCSTNGDYLNSDKITEEMIFMIVNARVGQRTILSSGHIRPCISHLTSAKVKKMTNSL